MSIAKKNIFSKNKSIFFREEKLIEKLDKQIDLTLEGLDKNHLNSFSSGKGEQYYHKTLFKLNQLLKKYINIYTSIKEEFSHHKLELYQESVISEKISVLNKIIFEAQFQKEQFSEKLGKTNKVIKQLESQKKILEEDSKKFEIELSELKKQLNKKLNIKQASEKVFNDKAHLLQKLEETKKTYLALLKKESDNITRLDKESLASEEAINSAVINISQLKKSKESSEVKLKSLTKKYELQYNEHERLKLELQETSSIQQQSLARLNTLNNDLSKLDQEIYHLKCDISGKKTEKSKSDNESKKLKEEIKLKESNLKQLKSTLENFSQKSDALKVKIDTLSKKYQKQTLELKEVSRKESQLKNDIRLKKSEVKKYDDLKLKTLSNNLRKKEVIKKLRPELTNLNRKYSILDRELKQLTKEDSILEEQKSLLTTKNQELKDSIKHSTLKKDQLILDIAQKQKDILTLTSSFRSLSIAEQGLSDNLIKLEAKKKGLNKQKELREKDLENERARVKVIEKTFSEEIQEVSQLEDSIADILFQVNWTRDQGSYLKVKEEIHQRILNLELALTQTKDKLSTMASSQTGSKKKNLNIDKFENKYVGELKRISSKFIKMMNAYEFEEVKWRKKLFKKQIILETKSLNTTTQDFSANLEAIKKFFASEYPNYGIKIDTKLESHKVSYVQVKFFRKQKTILRPEMV